MFVLHDTSGETPLCQVKRKQLGLLMHRRKHEISPLLPQVGRGSVAPRITPDHNELHNSGRSSLTVDVPPSRGSSLIGESVGYNSSDNTQVCVSQGELID